MPVVIGGIYFVVIWGGPWGMPMAIVIEGVDYEASCKIVKESCEAPLRPRLNSFTRFSKYSFPPLRSLWQASNGAQSRIESWPNRAGGVVQYEAKSLIV